MGQSVKPVVIISAINIRNGGPLSILQDCLSYLQSELLKDYKIVALVHDQTLLKGVDGIEFIEYPSSASSYCYRLYYEYYSFKKLSLQLKPTLWLSLHDMTPNVTADVRAVYCHNPSPFYQMTLKERLLDPRFSLFNSFYKLLYRINIAKNDYVIVQQEWLRTQFQTLFKLGPVVVAYPDIHSVENTIEVVESSAVGTQFFFPTFPRFFKNIEVIIDAVRLLNQSKREPFRVTITIDGTENSYARHVMKYARGVENIRFIGQVSRDDVYKLYKHSDCLIFPSKLETWGLPITECKSFNKPMLVADLDYAHETVGEYDKVDFFSPEDDEQLARLMEKVISGRQEFEGNLRTEVAEPFTHTWAELFKLLLGK